MTPTDEATHAYVGRHACGHVSFLVVDDGHKGNSRSIARIIESGGYVERMTLLDARHVPLTRCSKCGGRR